MQEIWKDIPGYEGLYQASNLGNIKSIGGSPRWGYKERILKIHNNNGYRRLYLCKNHKRKDFLVHRLVLLTFRDNPENKPHVNHINGIRNDNRVENLEWCTRGENEHHKYILGYKGPMPWLGKFSKEHARSKSIIQYNILGEIIKEWDSLMDINRELGFSIGNISSCCNGKRKLANSYIWKFKTV